VILKIIGYSIGMKRQIILWCQLELNNHNHRYWISIDGDFLYFKRKNDEQFRQGSFGTISTKAVDIKRLKSISEEELFAELL
jgi:hypothetical protein